MIIIFQCFGGTHTSVVAASIYLGKLPREKPPRPGDILALPYFDRMESSSMGTLNYAGDDAAGNPVFILGSGRWGAQVRRLAGDLLKLAGKPGMEIAFIDCLPLVSLPVRLGGFLSRRLGFVAMGRPIVTRGIIRSYHRLLELVERFEQNPTGYLLK